MFHVELPNNKIRTDLWIDLYFIDRASKIENSKRISKCLQHVGLEITSRVSKGIFLRETERERLHGYSKREERNARLVANSLECERRLQFG